MQGQIEERWETLCEQAASEQDPVRLMELIEQVNRLLKDKEDRLAKQRPASGDGA